MYSLSLSHRIKKFFLMFGCHWGIEPRTTYLMIPGDSQTFQILYLLSLWKRENTLTNKRRLKKKKNIVKTHNYKYYLVKPVLLDVELSQ